MRGPGLRVVIAEDSVLLREGLVRLLEESGGEVVARVGDGPSLVAAVVDHRPDVSVVDVRMPPTQRDEGLRAAIEARRLVPGSPVLVLSQYVEREYASELLADRGGRRRLPAEGPGRPTSASSWTRCDGSPRAARRSTRRSSPSSWSAAGATTGSPR